jgi:hypothetical protein
MKLTCRDIIFKWESFKETALEAENLYNETKNAYLVYDKIGEKFYATKKPQEDDEIIDHLTDDKTDFIGFINFGHDKYDDSVLSILFNGWYIRHYED